jgi:hypothetical protein
MPLTDANYVTLETAELETANSYAAIAELDLASWTAVAVTLATNADYGDVRFQIFAANINDYNDEILLQAETLISAGETGSYSGSIPYRYFRVKIKSASEGVAGKVTVSVIAKPRCHLTA